jgi:hypothetical protein
MGLSKEYILPNCPVTIDVENVNLSGALNLILKPLGLGYLIQNEVLTITSKAWIDANSITVRTYPVSDLLFGVPKQVTVDLRKKTARAEPRKDGEFTQGIVDFDGLRQLVLTTVEPDSWDEKGGQGSLRFYETTLSLVVRQTQSVHEQIRELLEQLRRLQDLQVCLAVRSIETSVLKDQALAKKLAPGTPVLLDPQQLAALQAAANQKKAWDAPKITLFNGQTASLILPAKGDVEVGLDLCPVVSADRRFVRLATSLFTQSAKGRMTSSQIILKDGQTILLDATKLMGGDAQEQKILMVTPTMVIQEDEEELLGVPPQKPLSRVTPQKPLSVAAPRIIIQEEEEELIGIGSK